MPNVTVTLVLELTESTDPIKTNAHMSHKWADTCVAHWKVFSQFSFALAVTIFKSLVGFH